VKWIPIPACCVAALTVLIHGGALAAAPVTAEDAARRQEAVRAEIERYLDKQIEAADDVKRQAWRRDFSSIEAYEKSVEPWRQKLWDMIGGDPYPKPPLNPKQELIAEFDTHVAYRVWLSAFDGVKVYGVLLVPKAPPPDGRGRPALVCVHGMSGTPEGLCGLLDKPDYHNNLGVQAVKRGYVVFAPSDVNNYKTRSWLDRKAILVGQRMQALEQHKLVRVVDYLCARDDVDPKCVGAYGISWGGRTVMYGAALDQRIAACAISGHFNELVPKMVTPSEHYTAFIQTGEDYSFFWRNFLLFDEVDVVSLICPRPVLIEQGRQDKVVYWEMSQRAFRRVKEIYDKLGVGDRATYALFEGPHEIHGVEAFEFFGRHLK
jgi:cephalosporin-C deacetylase-like acetyl esterase